MERTLYGDLTVWKRRPQRQPLLLQGARQVGKTYLLRLFGSREFRQTHYVNFERPANLGPLFGGEFRPRRILDQLAIQLQADIDPLRDLLILDEIQECPAALTSLKYFAEELPELALCCAGSLFGVSLGNAPFPVGKVEFLRLYPLSFGEFLEAANPRASAGMREAVASGVLPEPLHRLLWGEMTVYFVTGGLPQAVQSYLNGREANPPEALREARRVQANLLRGYQADFAKHSGKENANHINRVFEAGPTHLARAVDGSGGRFRFRGVIPNRSKFVQLAGPIDWLVRAGLLLKASLVSRPEVPLRAYAAENLFKLYLFDIGMLGCMLDLPIDAVLGQDYGSYRGYYAENFVAQEFTATGHEDLFWWSGRQSGIEFLRVEGGSVVPVEVKAGTCTRSRSLAAYAEKHKPARTLRLSGLGLDRRRRDFQNYPLYLAGQVLADLGAGDGTCQRGK